MGFETGIQFRLLDSRLRGNDGKENLWLFTNPSIFGNLVKSLEIVMPNA
jgi:hypothetical protein